MLGVVESDTVAGTANHNIVATARAAAIGFAPGVCLMVDIIANNVNLRASRKVTSWNLDMEMATITLSTPRVTWPIVKVSFIILEKMTPGLRELHQI